jgi:hypothetical protein
MSLADRRRFLKVLGAGTALAAFPGSIQRALALPTTRRTGTLEDVEHIVILMQENRSFDHYFGTLRGVRGFGDPRAIKLPSGDPVWKQPNGTRTLLPFHPKRAEPRAPVTRGSPPRLGRPARGLEQRQARPVGRGQGPDHDGVPHARRHPVPLRPGRRLHGLRRVPLLCARPDRSATT